MGGSLVGGTEIAKTFGVSEESFLIPSIRYTYKEKHMDFLFGLACFGLAGLLLYLTNR